MNNKKKIVIDTNVLYSWVEVSPNPKLTSADIEKLALKYELYISTPTIIEFLVKHRDNLDVIKKCLQPIIELKLIPISVGFVPISNDILKKFYAANTLSEVKADIDSLLDLKILKEAEFLRFFFVSVMIGTLYCLREEGYFKLSKNEEDNMFLKFTRVALESNGSLILNELIATLKQGYDTNTEQQVVRERMVGLITTFLNLWVLNYYFVKNSMISDFSNPDPIKLAQVKKDISTDKFLTHVSQFADNPLQIISKKKYRKHFSKYIEELKQELQINKLITDSVLEYILFKMEKHLQKNAKVNKNDMIDLLILYSFYLEGYMLLTLDNKLIEALEKVDPESYSFIKSLCI